MEQSFEKSSSENVTDNNVLLDPTVGITEKKKTLPRVYHGFWIFVFLVGILMAVVSLGFFGVKYSEVKSYKEYYSLRTCILFCSRTEDDKIALSKTGVCSYVLVSISAIMLLFIICVIYNIVLMVLGPKILSPLRILDLVLSVLAVLISFTVSVVVHAGLTASCKAFSASNCRNARLIPYGSDAKIGFYNEINVTKSVLWIITVGCILLSLLNGALVIAYCMKGRRQREAEVFNKLDEDEPQVI